MPRKPAPDRRPASPPSSSRGPADSKRAPTLAGLRAEIDRIDRDLVALLNRRAENSTHGRIADTLEMFTKLPNLKVRAEVRLRVHHCLLGRCEWGQVRRVYSKAQALSQCRHWLGKNLPQASLIETVSTAVAAELVQREEFAAAVASRPAGSAYGLNGLAEHNDGPHHHVTRVA